VKEKNLCDADHSAAMDGGSYDPLADAKARTETQLVELPGFGDGKPWYARLRRVSLLGLAKAGKIPNPLMATVTELYQTGVCKSSDLALAADVMLMMAGEALAQPTMEELEAAGVPLTDEQLTAIYLYAQRGVDALRPFRRQAAVSRAVPSGADVPPAAKPDAKHS